MAKETFGIGMHGQDTLIETPVAGNSVEAVLKELIQRAE